jgi:dihydroorotase
MKLLIKQARIVDPHSPFNNQSRDIFIENGIITEIGEKLSAKADREIYAPDLHVSPGWLDIFSDFCDPGFEYKETIETGAAAAAAGGYTDVLIIPNTHPVIQNKASVEYIIRKSASLPVRIHPIGAITKNTEGRELAEMYDMRLSGAAAFSDGTHCLQSAGILLKALQYVKAFDGVVIQLPDDKSICPQGLMNEGIISTQLGLPGQPPIAEELMVARDIKLARYAESKIHFTGVSTKKSIDYISRGKESGLAVTCSVTPYHLYFCDEDLVHYDTSLKVNPPLRTRDERENLKQLVLSGKVDCIATHHQPHEYDSKTIEFEYAKTGMTGLETSFGILRTVLPEVDLHKWIDMLSINPRKIFGLKIPSVNKGEEAILSLFQPSRKWTVHENNFQSRSKNTPFIGKELTGKPLGIIRGEKIQLNS